MSNPVDTGFKARIETTRKVGTGLSKKLPKLTTEVIYECGEFYIIGNKVITKENLELINGREYSVEGFKFKVIN